MVRKIILTVLQVVTGCPTNVTHMLTRRGIKSYLLKDKWVMAAIPRTVILLPEGQGTVLSRCVPAVHKFVSVSFTMVIRESEDVCTPLCIVTVDILLPLCLSQ